MRRAHFPIGSLHIAHEPPKISLVSEKKSFRMKLRKFKAIFSRLLESN